MIRLDANYVLRYLTNDNEKMSAIAEEAILNEDIFISSEVLAEVVYVLRGVYDLSRKEVSEALQALMEADNVQIHDKYIIQHGLKIYSEKSLDFVDCLLCAYSKVDTILTFDKKLMKCVDAK
jgi:predicted nucleic-acid-binding protein